MAGSVNRVILIGNLGKDPEIRATQDGKEIVNMTLATSESWKDKRTGERKEKTEWHRVVIFNEHLVKVAKEYLHKGSKLYIDGQLQTRKWTNKDGVDQYSTEVVLQAFGGCVVLLDSRSDARVTSEESQPDEVEHKPAPELDDQIPFAWLIGFGLSLMLFIQNGGIA